VLLDQLAFARSVLYGTAVADATLQKSNPNGEARLRIGHSIDKSEYLIWKYKHIKQIVLMSNLGVVPGGKYRKSPRDYVYINSYRAPEVTEVYKLVYRDGKKVITEDFLSIIDDVVLAVWFMDDGSYDKHVDALSYWLHTNAFTYEENVKLAEFLRDKYNLTPKVQKIKSGKCCLRFLRGDTWTIEEIIKPVVSQVSCMHYKLASYHDKQPRKNENKEAR
jgi:hypothetical protein